MPTGRFDGVGWASQRQEALVGVAVKLKEPWVYGRASMAISADGSAA